MSVAFFVDRREQAWREFFIAALRTEAHGRIMPLAPADLVSRSAAIADRSVEAWSERFAEELQQVDFLDRDEGEDDDA